MVRSLSCRYNLDVTNFALLTEALFEFTQNTYIGSEGVSSPPNIPFAIRLASGSAVLTQPVIVIVTSGPGSAIGMWISSTELIN